MACAELVLGRTPAKDHKCHTADSNILFLKIKERLVNYHTLESNLVTPF